MIYCSLRWIASQVDLASSLLALARLSFAQLVDAGKLFSRTAMVQSPECAAAVLEVFFFKGEPHFLGAGWVFSCFGGMRNMKIWGSHNFIIMFLLKMVNNPAKWWISSAILWSYELQWWAKQQTGSSATTCGSVQYILWRKMDNEQWPNIPNRVNGSKYDLQRFLDTLVPHWSNPELMLNTRPEPLAIWVYSRFGGWDWSK